MATGDLLDFGVQRAAAKEHAMAVTRDYISQPRLSEFCKRGYGLMHLATCCLSVQDCFGCEWSLGDLGPSEGVCLCRMRVCVSVPYACVCVCVCVVCVCVCVCVWS